MNKYKEAEKKDKEPNAEEPLEEIINVDGLIIDFSGFKAVDGISFSVKKGEIFGFLGANGAGKTTTIRTLCGLLSPSAGKISVNGKNISDISSLKPMIGYMSQKFTLYPDLTPMENMGFAGALYRIPKSEIPARHKKIFSFMGIDDIPEKPVRTLSGGTRQILSLAASIIHDPQLIFLDEPTAGTSIQTRISFWKLIKALAADGKTIFVTTHYMDEAENCGRIALMERGHIIALDTPQNLKHKFFPNKILEISSAAAAESGALENAGTENKDKLNEILAKSAEEIKKLNLGESSFFGNKLRLIPGSSEEQRIKLAAWIEEKSPALTFSQTEPNLEDVFLKAISNSGNENIDSKIASKEEKLAGRKSERKQKHSENSFFRRIAAIALKEAMHIQRDPFTLAVAFLLPLFFVIAFGYIIDLDYKNFPLIVNDNDKTPISRKLQQAAQASGYFEIMTAKTPADAEKLLKKNSMQALMIIPPGFGKNIENKTAHGRAGKAAGNGNAPGNADIQLLADGTDNAGAAMLSAYMQGISANFISRLAKENTGSAPASMQLRTLYMFNPSLDSRRFIVPALNTIIIGFLAIVLTALTVAKEWENGSMELLLATPAKPSEIIIGKLLPYLFLSFTDCLIIFCIALLLFKMPFQGSFILYLLACMLYITGALSLGLFISVMTRQQQAAIQFAMAIGLLPSIIFSGFIFPIENMPIFFRWLTVIFPQRWFLLISRKLFLSDPGFQALAMPFLALLAFAFLMTAMAIKKFKTDAEP
ncbi:MAG: ABC transporter permease [Elusimicrobiales bacterium]|nr:ABC transporter permease [Elusimicrobiales bacterium]